MAKMAERSHNEEDVSKTPYDKIDGRVAEVVTELPNRSHSRAWVVNLLILICYISTYISFVPFCTQYFFYRIARDKYNISAQQSDQDASCENQTSKRETVHNKVNKEALNIILMGIVAGGIPSLFVCFFSGSYSDYLGRRFLFIASATGSLVRVCLLCLIVAFDWNIYLFIVGSAFDGFVGSFYTVVLASVSLISDITSNLEARVIKFALMEGIVLVSGAVAQFVIGLLIKKVDFLVPVICLTGMMVVAFLLAVLVLPETKREHDGTFQWSILPHVRKVFGFYFLDGTKVRRVHFSLGLAIFFTINLTTMGRQSVETTFVLSSPICWNSMEIGLFSSVRLILMSIVAVIALKIVGRRVSLEVIGLASILSGAAGYLSQAFSTDTTTMYISAVIGIGAMTINPIPRTLMSEIASPLEQGALFSSYSVVEVVSTLISSILYTAIYNATADSFKGSVFIVIAGVCCIAFVLLLLYLILRRTHPVVVEHIYPAPEIKVKTSQSDSGKQSRQSSVEGSGQSESSPLIKA